MSSIRDSASFWGKKLEISDEETVEAERPRRNRTFLVIFLWSSLISLLFLSLLMLGPYFLNVVVIHNGSGAETPFTARAPTTGNQYLLGVGKADITGPVVELNFMGYASLSQIGTGLRQRIYSRAFIVGDINNSSQRFLYLVLDTQSGDTAIRYGILQALANLGSAYAVYGQQNVAVTGTHQHSGPGAWVNYLLPQITSLGFDKQSYQAIVDGAILSIQRAHQSLAPGYLGFGSTNITDANLSRSVYAYLANPAAERAQYTDDVDKAMTMLRFQRASDRKIIGVLTWFPVHGTSMLENNTHVTGDNKGVAAYLFEQAVVGESTAADGFVAGFSQSNVGDTTPNVLGAWCDDGSGKMCTINNSTCGGTSQACHGRGPLFQKLDLGVSSCFEIGRRQFAGAKALYDTFDTVSTPITDNSVKFFHFYQDMSAYKFPLANGTIVSTCPAALGYSFAAGTSDGPGAFDFTQNDPGKSNANPLWSVVSALIKSPSASQVACQYPKPILLDTGELSVPYQWSPNIVDIQLLRVGQLIIIVSPSEATTMSGRRWRAAISAAASSQSITASPPLVVLGGPANTYAHYVATEEEYSIQRYEGASTLYGPHQLAAYISLTVSNIGYLSAHSTSQPANGPLPPNNVNSSFTFIPPVLYDNPPLFKSFGQVLSQPKPSYIAGDVINATFVGANPRNNLRLEATFAAVEMQLPSGVWQQVRSDADWSLVYSWTRDDTLLGTSHVVISWESEAGVAVKGRYRIRYYGDAKGLGGKITGFQGVSNTFTLS